MFVIEISNGLSSKGSQKIADLKVPSPLVGIEILAVLSSSSGWREEVFAARG